MQGDTRLGNRTVDGREDGGQCGGNPAGARHLALAQHGASRGLFRLCLLGLAAAREVHGGVASSPHALARGLELDAALQLGCARRVEVGDKDVTGTRVEHGPRPGGEVVVGGGRPLDGGLGLAHVLASALHTRTEALRLSLGGLGLRARTGQQFAAGRTLCILIADGGQRGGRRLLRGRQLAPRLVENDRGRARYRSRRHRERRMRCPAPRPTPVGCAPRPRPHAARTA